ncbi:MAG: ATP-binding protein, partial [Cyanobacteria bacterium J06639_18]
MGASKRTNSVKKINHLATLNRIFSRIRQSLNLQTVLDSTATEVRCLLQIDRVKIYKFDKEGNGQVVAESINGDRLPSLKGLYFSAGDIPPQSRELFIKAKVRSIVNLEEQQMRLLEPNRLPSTSTEELTIEQVSKEPLKKLLQRPVDPCHVEYLNLMGVKSTLVLPILKERELWGLLIAHHARAKNFSQFELQIMQMITEQLEIAIVQASLMENLQANAKREKVISDITAKIYSSLDIEKILGKVLNEVVREIKASGGILLLTQTIGNEIFFISYGSTVQVSFQEWLNLFQSLEINNQPKIILDIYQNKEFKKLISAFQNTKIRSILVVKLQSHQENLGYLAVFRSEIDTEKLWAGYNNTDKRQQRPRESFEQWKEIKKGKAPQWTQREQRLLESLGNHFGIAILQESLYREKQQRLLVEIHNQELKKARTVAENANRLKSEFLSSTSHELRTPIASKLTYLKLLKEGLYDNENELEEYIQAAHLSAENLVHIVNDILDIAKIEAGRMEVDLEPVRLQPLLEKQHSFFKAQTIHRNLKLILESEVDIVWADENKLQQILTNLIANAFKFTKEGEIKLKVLRCMTSAKPEIQFSVSDTGIGIEPNKQSILFEAFVQADGSIRRRYGGMGLGLTICKNFVELMGGKIWLESPGVNQGTT